MVDNPGVNTVRAYCNVNTMGNDVTGLIPAWGVLFDAERLHLDPNYMVISYPPNPYFQDCKFCLLPSPGSHSSGEFVVAHNFLPQPKTTITLNRPTTRSPPTLLALVRPTRASVQPRMSLATSTSRTRRMTSGVSKRRFSTFRSLPLSTPRTGSRTRRLCPRPGTA